MADIGASNWSETDASNTDAAPDGFPEGMAPSGVNNGLRAHQGAIKRFWNKINAVKTTGGTTSAYTLSYDVSPAAYVDGEIISFVVNATNAAAATINVNALGAKALRLFGGNLLPGALLTGQIVQARYGSAAGAFDIIPQNGWVRLSEVDASAATTVDFTSIPAGVNHLQGVFEVNPGTTGTAFTMRTYGADGVIDTGGSDYVDTGLLMSPAATGSFGQTASSFRLTGAETVSTSSAIGISIEFIAANIQNTTYTKFLCRGAYYSGSSYNIFSTLGVRQEADRITGVRLIGSNAYSGKLTLLASA